MVIVIIIKSLLAYLGNSNKSSRIFGMSWIEPIRCHDELEVMSKADVENNVKISCWCEEAMTTRNPRGGRVIT